MSRKYGVPFSIREYSVSVKRSHEETPVRVKGLETMSFDVDAETDDGRPVGQMWSEKYVKSRGISGTIEGRPIVDRSTGLRDRGQELLHRAAYSAPGQENDMTLRIADPVGHLVDYDCIVTKETLKADEDGETVTWEWESVGAPREREYIPVQRVHFVHRSSSTSTIEIGMNSLEVIHLVFTPTNASNRRFKYILSDESIVTICDVDEDTITVRGLRVGSTALQVWSMNNNYEAKVMISVRQTV